MVPALEMKEICFAYNVTPVLKNVNFSVQPGEIMALLGENGAGKTTLMDILGGINRAYAGTVLFSGTPVHFSSPGDAIAAGVGFVHQELNLVNDLTVYENMFLGNLLRRGPLLDRQKMKRQADELLARMQVPVDSALPVRQLGAACKQLVEICRVLMLKPGLLIMDEPTASLPENEVGAVFDIMRRLKDRGVAIVFISHKLNEVMEICDRYTVLRNGCSVARGEISETDPARLAALIVGHEVTYGERLAPAKPGEPVLSLAGYGNGRSFRNISLTVRSGEVLGVTGLLGDGRSELFLSVVGGSGCRTTGEMRLCGRPVRFRSVHQAMKAGVAYVPENRKENGILKDMSVLDNGTVTLWEEHRRGVLSDRAKLRLQFARQQDALHIKVPDPDKRITILSGGNQQKVVLGKWLVRSPKLYILDNPTQGVDIGAKEDIYKIIRSLAADGAAVVVLSPEAKELLRVCDRGLVMFNGEVAAALQGTDMNEQKMMFYATGGGKTAQKGNRGDEQK